MTMREWPFIEISDVARELLATKTIEEFNTFVDKHKEFIVTPYETMMLKTHKAYLFGADAYTSSVMSHLN